jgi:hypothetical protein
MMQLAYEKNIFHKPGLSDMSNGLNSNIFPEDQDEQYHIGDGGDSWQQPYDVCEASSRKRDNEDHLDLHINGTSKRAKSHGADFGGMQPGTANRSNSLGMGNSLFVSTVVVWARPGLAPLRESVAHITLLTLHARSMIS